MAPEWAGTPLKAEVEESSMAPERAGTPLKAEVEENSGAPARAGTPLKAEVEESSGAPDRAGTPLKAEVEESSGAPDRAGTPLKAEVEESSGVPERAATPLKGGVAESSGAPERAGTPLKAGVEESSGAPDRAGTPLRAGVEESSGAPDRAGTTQKAEVEESSGAPERAGTPLKAGVKESSGAPERTGTPLKAGVEESSGAPERAGTPPKAGVEESPGGPERAGTPPKAGVGVSSVGPERAGTPPKARVGESPVGPERAGTPPKAGVEESHGGPEMARTGENSGRAGRVPCRSGYRAKAGSREGRSGTRGLAAVCLALSLVMAAPMGLVSCEPRRLHQRDDSTVLSYIRDFRSIPGITQVEINAVEGFQAQGRVFSFGTLMSAESFRNQSGKMAGFLPAFSGFLTDMLHVQFEHTFYERGELAPALAQGWLDFASEVQAEGHDGKTFFTTDPIYERIVKSFTRKGAVDLSEMAVRKLPVFGFLPGTGIRERVLDATAFPVRAETVHSYQEAADRILSGTMDAFFEESSALTFFDGYDEVVSADYFPPIDLPLTFATGNRELSTIISVVQKFIRAGGDEYLSQLYADSSLDNQRNMFESSLTRGQHSWLWEFKDTGAKIRVAAETDNYPVSFYNSQTETFEGIAHDSLAEIARLTGLSFEIVNGPGAGPDELELMVLSGEADLLATFNFMYREQMGMVLSPRPHSWDRFALLTTIESPEIKFDQLFYGTVGLVRGDRRSELFRKWFPNSRNIIWYRTLEKALEALKRGDIMYVMGSTNLLLSLTNYREDPSFKAGLIFEHEVPYGFAFSTEELNLRDVVGKAAALVPVLQINERWNSRMFDYNRKFLRDTVPYFAVFLVLLLGVLAGLFYENRKNRALNRDLESLVDERTRKLQAAQVDLERERQLFKRILDSCPLCFTITMDGFITFMTPFAESFLGMRDGDSIYRCFAVREELEGALSDLDAGETLNWRPMRVYRMDGAVREVLVNAFVSDYYGRDGVMAWFTDVTELRENARDLALAKDIAEDSAKAKSEFLANMSHEIRTPMNAIVGLTQLTLQTDLSDVQRDYLEKTSAAAKSLLGIINDILDFTKIEAGKLSMEKIEFQLEDVIDGVLNLVLVRANEKSLELLLSVGPDTPTSLEGDPLRLGQILNNLMSNAVKFTETGRVTLSIDALQESQGQAILKFRIQDTGIGLSDEQIRKLFTAFNQADTSVTRRFGGTGLGLAISRRLVEMMGGKIWCEGAPGQGSTFYFTAMFGVLNQKQRYASLQEDLKSLTALAVDDYEPALTVIRDELMSLGLNVYTAEDGPRALEIIRKGLASPPAVDVAILDWQMPGWDGIETARQIREHVPEDRRPALIMATSHDRDHILPEAAEAGIRTVIPKPVVASSLVQAITECLSHKPRAPKKARRRQTMDASRVAHLKGSLILLAEDNEVNQLVARKLLKNAGFEVDIAANGREAFEKVQARDYALVLMDIQMPEMDGLTATRAIRALPGYELLPIVAMTAHAMSGDRDLSLAAGMNDHITKPINLDALFAALNKWIKAPSGEFSGEDVGESAGVGVGVPAGDGVGESAGDGVGVPIGDGGCESAGDGVGVPAGDGGGESAGDSVGLPIGDGGGESAVEGVGVPAWNGGGESVGESVRNDVRMSAGDAVREYSGKDGGELLGKDGGEPLGEDVRESSVKDGGECIGEFVGDPLEEEVRESAGKDGRESVGEDGKESVGEPVRKDG
ncbi:MAG: response regulator [Deltaproteobacteria bacterium]|nr:response regulator [Deltaproteobacteria bacterium]